MECRRDGILRFVEVLYVFVPCVYTHINVKTGFSSEFVSGVIKATKTSFFFSVLNLYTSDDQVCYKQCAKNISFNLSKSNQNITYEIYILIFFMHSYVKFLELKAALIKDFYLKVTFNI
jgi:hypothetical protein